MLLKHMCLSHTQYIYGRNFTQISLESENVEIK